MRNKPLRGLIQKQSPLKHPHPEHPHPGPDTRPRGTIGKPRKLTEQEKQDIINKAKNE